MEFYANKLKGRIVSEGLTMSELSAKIGINPVTLSRKISANGDFSRRELQLIKTILHLPDDDFIDIFFNDKLA